jgi:hypothetical protein
MTNSNDIENQLMFFDHSEYQFRTDKFYSIVKKF